MNDTERSAAGNKSVLVVDDEQALARAIERVLRSAGFTVTIAPDGAAAVEAISNGTFDVILSDITMPKMTGVELLRFVRARDLDVPVILMTGNPTIATAIDAVSLGALQYLEKPMTNDVIVAAVSRASHLHLLAKMKRDSLRVLGEVHTQASDRAGLEVNFERALESMWMAFQPIVDTKRGRLFGYEALLRTREASLPHPGAMLDAAERLTRLHDLGRRVRALSAEAFLRADKDALLFVNLHTRDLLDPSLYDANAPLSKIASRVVLEITERATMDGIEDLTTRVSDLRDQGFRIAIDDLGAGYSGLSSFVSLEPDVVKLDISLVRNAHQSAVRSRLIRSMTAVCTDMGIQVIAEGIELPEERDCVRAAGCELLQGYLFARPGPPFPEIMGLERP